MTPTITSFVNSFQNRLEPPVRQHLKKVYGALTMTCAAGAAGACLDVFTNSKAGVVSFLVSVALLLLLFATPDDGKNTSLRLSYLLGFGFTSGMSLGPLLEYVMSVDPAIVMTALLGSTLVFVCFSVAAMLAERGSWLFLGGPLLALFSSMMAINLVNLFVQSPIIYQVHLYAGLVLMCGLVLFDTQVIIEKRRLGSKDFIGHSLELFSDFSGMFRRLLVILAQEEEDNRRRRKRE